MTLKMSPLVMMPTSFPLASSTGRPEILFSSMITAAFSTVSSGMQEMTFRAMMSFTLSSDRR